MWIMVVPLSLAVEAVCAKETSILGHLWVLVALLSCSSCFTLPIFSYIWFLLEQIKW